MEEKMNFCQSCGIPLLTEEVLGTNADKNGTLAIPDHKSRKR